MHEKWTECMKFKPTIAEKYIAQNYKGKRSFCTKSYQSCDVILDLSFMMIIIIPDRSNYLFFLA